MRTGFESSPMVFRTQQQPPDQQLIDRAAGDLLSGTPGLRAAVQMSKGDKKSGGGKAADPGNVRKRTLAFEKGGNRCRLRVPAAGKRGAE